MKPKAFIFDFFGVMCPNISGNWNKKHSNEISLEEQEMYLRDADSGRISEQEAFTLLAKKISQQGDTLRNEWISSAVVYQEMVNYIIELKNTSKVVVCSNAPKTFFYEVLKKNNIETLFDIVVVSEEVGLLKPDPKMFELVLKKLGMQKGEVIFFDDTKKNVEGAEKFGIKAIWFNSPNQIEPFTS